MMKKILLFVVLLGISVSLYAQKASVAYFVLNKTDTSVTEDENIQVKYTFNTKSCDKYCEDAPYPVLRVEIYNKTDKILYIDLGTSYLKRNRVASPIYVPQSTSTTSGQNVGIGVNAGAIANATGISGPLGTALGGVSIGGGKSSATTTTTYAERYVSIPPKSSIFVNDMQMFVQGFENVSENLYRFKGNYRLYVSKDFKNLKIGEVINYSESNSPFSIGIYINYSLSENFENCTGIETTYKIIKLIGSNHRQSPKKSFRIIDKRYPNWESDVNNGKIGIVRLWMRPG